MVEQYRVKQGPGYIKKYGDTFARIEKQFGVPAEVITAFWALETDFGQVMGDDPTLISLATLGYDCRRPDLFRPQLIAALKIIDRGDLTVDEMRGPWAGEMGQFQFLASHYLDYGVDFDGDGKVKLRKSTPDALASAAQSPRPARLAARRAVAAGGQGAGRVPVGDGRPADQVPALGMGRGRRQGRRQGAAVGRARRGAAPADGAEGAGLPRLSQLLRLPRMELVAGLFDVRRLFRHPARRRAEGDARQRPGTLSFDQIKQLQTILTKKGYNVGKIDGIIGELTREAVKDVQIKLGLPADSYPTQELLAKLS